jgi:putative transposase
MAEWCSRLKVEVWAYCLIPKLMHLIVAPQSEEGLRRAIGDASAVYEAAQFREKWRGICGRGDLLRFRWMRAIY